MNTREVQLSLKRKHIYNGYGLHGIQSSVL